MALHATCRPTCPWLGPVRQPPNAQHCSGNTAAPRRVWRHARCRRPKRLANGWTKRGCRHAVRPRCNVTARISRLVRRPVRPVGPLRCSKRGAPYGSHLSLGATALALFLTACAGTATPAASSAPAVVTRPSSQPSATAVVTRPSSQPSATAAPSPGAGANSSPWTRPLDIKPVAPSGIFKVVSANPSPGEKVPIFFMGAQF